MTTGYLFGGGLVLVGVAILVWLLSGRRRRRGVAALAAHRPQPRYRSATWPVGNEPAWPTQLAAPPVPADTTVMPRIPARPPVPPVDETAVFYRVLPEWDGRRG